MTRNMSVFNSTGLKLGSQGCDYLVTDSVDSFNRRFGCQVQSAYL